MTGGDGFRRSILAIRWLTICGIPQWLEWLIQMYCSVGYLQKTILICFDSKLKILKRINHLHLMSKSRLPIADSNHSSKTRPLLKVAPILSQLTISLSFASLLLSFALILSCLVFTHFFLFISFYSVCCFVTATSSCQPISRRFYTQSNSENTLQWILCILRSVTK